jgi:hypothetical protein
MNWLYKRKAALEKKLFPKRALLWRRWKQHDPASRAVIDQRPWTEFLARYTRAAPDGTVRVDYAAVSPDDISRLDEHLARCAAVAISAYARDEQFAYWANLYNALTVRLVLTHYPLRSIRQIGWIPIWLGGGPWNRKLITVEGVPLSLNDIEHRVLRRNWRHPLLHYAVNCGSIGCPNLRQPPFSGAAIWSELDQVARDFVNHPRGARFEGDALVVCSIYVWFQEDFGASDAGVIAHLKQYAARPLAEKLARATKIDRHQYDWRLNDAR